MIKEAVTATIAPYSTQTAGFLRTVIKESLQDFILNFIYTSKEYKTLIFTGGTCLRKIHNLPRLSEDIDFDFVETFNIAQFATDVEEYFKKTYTYPNTTTKVAKNKRTVFVKFPTLLGEVDTLKGKIESTMLFVRCDFSAGSGLTTTETKTITTGQFTFFARCYDLPTLFANKINAFLQRTFFKGNTQEVPFKGRDIFDLVWFLERAEKTQFSFEPNWPRVLDVTGLKTKQEVIKAIDTKIKLIKSDDVARDLEAFIENPQTVQDFSIHFQEILDSQLKNWRMFVE